MEKIRALVIGGDRRGYHKFPEIGPLFEEILSGSGSRGEFDVTLTDDNNYFLAGRIRPFDIILCCSLNPVITDRQADGLLEAVIGGTGFLGVHAASASFVNKSAYPNMLGGRFLTHPPLDGPFIIRVKNHGHPVLKDIADFEIADELYLMETYPPFETLLETEFQGFARPLAWVKPYGLGRVFYTSLGHGPAQMRNPAFRKIIRNAALWCAGVNDAILKPRL